MQLANSDDFAWTPIGGLGEVGMNCMVFQFGRVNIAVDAGILFADANDFGIDYVHPDFEFVLKQLPIKNWLITHGHEDHIGAVPAVLKAAAKLGVEPPTIWAPAFAAALIREKLQDGQFPGLKDFTKYIKVFEMDEDFEIQGVRVRPVSVRHSTPQSCSLYFRWESPGGKKLSAFHTSDFKIDPGEYEDGRKDTSRLDWIREAGLDFLLVDSTNAERPGSSTSELAVLPGLEKIMREAPGRVYVTLFSSNIYRISALIKIAQECGRLSCLAGRSMQSAFRLAREVGLFGSECPDTSDAVLLDSSEIGRRPPEKQLVICSGSQGETRSVLKKMSFGTHPDFQLGPDDTVLFSSKLIPGNEKSVSSVINGLLRSGARILWGDDAKLLAGGPVHASGHARRDEIFEILTALQPKNVIPVHGELRQLRACRALALQSGASWGLSPQNVFISENGSQLHFSRDSQAWEFSRRKDYAPLPKTLRFENFSSPGHDPFLKERKKLALGGAVSVSFDPTGRTQVQSAGFIPHEQLSLGLREQMEQEIEKLLFGKFKHQIKKGTLRNLSEEELVDTSAEIGRAIKRLCGFKPFVFLHIGEHV